MYVRSGIRSLRVEVSGKNVLVVYLVDLETYVLSVYRPPSYSVEENQELRDFLSDFCVGKSVVVMGDFNLPGLRWSGSGLSEGYVPPMEREFYDCFLSSGLHQWVEEGTFDLSDNILDLVFTSSDDAVGDVKVMPPLPGCHHCPVVLELE